MFNRIIDWAVTNRLLVVIALMTLTISAIFIIPKLNLDAFPDVTNVQVSVNTEAPGLAAEEVERCLNCDIQTVFTANLCIECDACIDVCPVDCLTITHNGEEDDLRTRLSAPADNKTQDLYVSADLPQTGRVMVKDEDVCVHCGLCAERCPTAAWDMKKYLYEVTKTYCMPSV